MLLGGGECVLHFRITKLDIFQSYFFGDVEFQRGIRTNSISRHRGGGKVLRFRLG